MKMGEVVLHPELVRRVAGLYRDMEAAYDASARTLDFSCSGCPDNCCDSYCLHHTYMEWAYLWQGLNTLAPDRLQNIAAKAADYVLACETALAKGKQPSLMCPLHADGLCTLYSHRLMICRLHGIPATLTRPDGRKLDFPGCFRCQEHVAGYDGVRPLDRTQFYRRLVGLELEFLGSGRMIRPKVKLTIAQMIVKGPPSL